MIRKGVLVNLIQLVKVAALVGITILVTRVTGAHGRGIYTLASSVAILAATITALGISWAGIYYIGKGLFPLADVASTLLTVSMAAAVWRCPGWRQRISCSNTPAIAAIAVFIRWFTSEHEADEATLRSPSPTGGEDAP